MNAGATPGWENRVAGHPHTLRAIFALPVAAGVFIAAGIVVGISHGNPLAASGGSEGEDVRGPGERPVAWWEQIDVGAQVGVALSLALISTLSLFPPFVRTSDEPFRSAATWGCCAGGFLAALGIVLSQTSPLFGPLEGAPFSPTRIDFLPAHAFGLGLAGLVIGGAVGLLRGERRDRGAVREDPAKGGCRGSRQSGRNIG